MKIELLYRTILKDKNGKILKTTKWTPCKSFLLQYLQMQYSLLAHTNVTVKDADGINRTIMLSTAAARDRWFHMDAGDNDENYGLVVGTGTTAPTNSDYQMETKIAHGTGAGQLDYGTHSFTAPSVVGANVDLIISRDFYNGSGSTITVTEIGAQLRCYDTGTVYRYFCIIRDVLASSQDVLDTQTLTVQYTIRTTV